MRKRARAVVIVAVLLLVAGSAAAQTRPSFAGRWTMAADPAASGRGGVGGLGQSAVITQDAGVLTITRTTQIGEFTATYRLDGAESKNTMNMQGAAVEQVSRTRWEGDRLIVDTSMRFNGNPVAVSMTMALDPSSGHLVVETTRPDMQGGGAPITTKAVYRKSPVTSNQ